jgi:hypothetical protein
MTAAFWDVTPYSAERVRRFGGTYPLHPQDGRVKPSQKPAEASGKQLYVTPKRRVFSELHGVTTPEDRTLHFCNILPHAFICGDVSVLGRRQGSSRSAYCCCFVLQKSWLQIATKNLFTDCLTYYPTSKMEATHSSETSVNFYRTTRLHIPKYGTLD